MEKPEEGVAEGGAPEKTEGICNHPGMRKTLLTKDASWKTSKFKQVQIKLISWKHHKQSHKGRAE